MSENVSRLGEILRSTAVSMRNELNQLRAGFTHGTVKGDGAEELVREFLRKQLPASIGITSGQALDSTGATSAQLDVIVYDALRTPMLFESPHEGQHLVPIEGVVAVVEVKSHLRKSDLPGLLANCRSVKALQKVAYFSTSITSERFVYGSQWVDVPVHYSVFAFESDNMYGGELNELQAEEPVHGRIDTLCYLDRGVNLNVWMNWDSKQPEFGATVRPGGGLADIAAHDRALVLWFAAFASVVVQSECRPIDLTRYLEGELAIQGSIPAGALVEAMREEGIVTGQVSLVGGVELPFSV